MQVIQESIIQKAKDFVKNNKGKLALLAATGAAGTIAYNKGALEGIANTVAENLKEASAKVSHFALGQRIKAGEANWLDKLMYKLGD